MWTRQRRKRNGGRLIVPAVSAAFLAYFGFHAWNGDSGIYSKYQLEERIGQLTRELHAMTANRVALERRVQLLHDGTLEKDILDEQARKHLNLAHGDEIVIMRDWKSEN